MAAKLSKATTAPELVAQSIAPDINLEDAIADEILDNLDWQKVRSSMLSKVKQRFFDWLTTSDRPVNISQFPELAALPDADEEEKAA